MKTMKGSMFFVIPMALVIFALLAAPAPAGDLNPPPGSPAPTMKTLDQIPPTWDQKLRSDDGDATTKCNSTRFKCVMDAAAVLDKETGLVWEKSPEVVGTDPKAKNWARAVNYCLDKAVGGRKGWRLPTIEELASLLEPGSASTVLLPTGHPFINIQGTFYWSATTNSSDNGYAYFLSFANETYTPPGGGKVFDPGTVIPCSKSERYDPFTAIHIQSICVRGGHGYDAFYLPAQ